MVWTVMDEQTIVGTVIVLAVAVVVCIGSLAYFYRKSHMSGNHQILINEDHDIFEGNGAGGNKDSSTASQPDREENPFRF